MRSKKPHSCSILVAVLTCDANVSINMSIRSLRVREDGRDISTSISFLLMLCAHAYVH